MAKQPHTELTRLTEEYKFMEGLRSDIMCNLKATIPLHMLSLVNRSRWTYRETIEA